MTPQQIALFIVALMEHEGQTLTAADQRAIERQVLDDTGRQKRYRAMMNAPAYQWQRPPAPRR